MRLEHADVEVNTNFLWQVVTGSVREVSSNNHSSCLGFFFFLPCFICVLHSPFLYFCPSLTGNQGSRESAGVLGK